MSYPNGSIQGLCSSSATGFAVCLAFLGYWGFQISNPWEISHLLVLVPLIIAALSFGLTPFFATSKREAPESIARYSYLFGLFCFLFSTVTALIISYLQSNHVPN